MKINIVIYASVLAKQAVEAIKDTHRELFSALDKHFEVNAIMHQDIDSASLEGFSVVLVATGGTEGIIVKEYDKLPRPLVLLTDGKANSLAATLELSSWIRDRGDSCTIIHGSIEKIISDLRARTAMYGQRIGVLGEPSDWLVASGVDYDLVKKAWGVEYIDIPLSEVERRFYAIKGPDCTKFASEFTTKAHSIVEPSKEDIDKAVRLYLAIKQLVDEYRLNAITVQCFSLISTLHTTGCLALALLNDEGIVAGCEGDLQTIFTMLYVKRIMGKDSFMANPAFVDTDRNEVVFAHCTIGLKQTTEYIIRSHFESQSGVAIQGIMPLKKVSIMKFGGKALEKSVILHGTIVENQADERKCRTQIRIALDPKTSNADYFLTGSIGNHHVIF